MPVKTKEFQWVMKFSGIVTGDSASVTADSGETPEIGHDETEWTVTLARNERSR